MVRGLSRPTPSQFPPLFRRSADLADRHLDAVSRAVMVGLEADRLAADARPGDVRELLADPAGRVVRGRSGRSCRSPAPDNRRASAADAERVRAGRIDVDRYRPRL